MPQSLIDDLQEPKSDLEGFYRLTRRVLDYLPNMISSESAKSGYRIPVSEVAGTRKFVRPLNDRLFLSDPQTFEDEFARFDELLLALGRGERVQTIFDPTTIDSVVYTLQQSIGAAFDLLADSNSARKHVGNRFEELIRAIFSRMGIANRHCVLNIPYETESGEKQYKCEIDLILSPHPEVRSTSQRLDPSEVIVSLKTTSKDRMGKIFMDKILLERFSKDQLKVIGIFLNDVQRKGKDGVSYTLVSGLFMVYSEFITEMDGVYYIDPPAATFQPPYNRFISPFSKLLYEDVWKLLGR